MRAALLVAIVVVAAGCGGGSSLEVGGAASVVPSDAISFTAVRTDHLQLVGLLRGPALPIGRLRPVLGSELDVAELPGLQLVAFTKPKDPSAIRRLGFRVAQIGGWTAFSRSADAIASVKGATTTLAAAAAYRSAAARLSGGALVRAYLRGGEAGRLVTSLPGQVLTETGSRRAPRGRAERSEVAGPHYQWGAAEIAPAGKGLRFLAVARSTPPTAVELQLARFVQSPSPPYTAHLLDEIPADAQFVADFEVVSGEFENADPSTLPPQLQTLLKASPALSFELDEILGGETAVYVRPGLEVTLVTQPADIKTAEGALTAVLPALKLGVPIRHAVIGGELVLSTSEHGIDAFRSAAPKLSADPTFKRRAKDAGLPAETTGLAYGTVPAALPFWESFAPFAGRTVVAYVDHGGGEFRVAVVEAAR